jgi:GNAT superfamily N-acetyltransferase
LSGGEGLSGPDALTVRATCTEAAYYELGNQVEEGPTARFVSNPATPNVWDNNCATRIRAATPAQVDDLMIEMGRRYRDNDRLVFKLDGLTPPAVEARMVLEGYEVDVMVHLVLPAHEEVRDISSRRAARSADAGRSAIEVRPVTGEPDWASLGRLVRADHVEAAAREGREVWGQDVTDQMVARKRQRAGALPFFLARIGGVDVGHGCAWRGTAEDGIGMVEDLFTAPDHRHMGVATALIAHGVDYARAGGAEAVMIGAAAEDTPRFMYAAMGFCPTFTSRTYLGPLGTTG